jgi:hypothetical protein
MATGRTVSASFLTNLDDKVLTLCNEMSDYIQDLLDNDNKKDFLAKYGKLSYTRDGGMGLGGGKLQRDAICTRGRQGKAPYSNRNLRWHPLVISEVVNKDFSKEIDSIEIDGVDNEQILVFVVNENGKKVYYPSDKVHELKKRYVVLPKHWLPHIDNLKHWNDTLWTQNSCVIPSLEACEWYNALETYAVLLLSISVGLYSADFKKSYKQIVSFLSNQKISKKVKLPTNNFPKNKEDIISCPVCKLKISESLEGFRKENRSNTWQPSW